MNLRKGPFENIVGKGENAGNQHFLLFPQCFLPFLTQISVFHLHLSSAKAFNLNQCKNLLFCRELTLYHTIPTFNDLREVAFSKHCEKRRKCW